MGWKKALLLLGLTFIVSLLFESIGVATGIIYGPYHYTDRLGVKFLALVPLLIPMAWFIMSYPSYTIVISIVTKLFPRKLNVWIWRLFLAAVGALAMTAWDLAMDPMMVASNYWVWDVQGAYFGVPWQNYGGWWLTIFVTFILFLTTGRITPPQESLLNKSFQNLAVWSYAITGFSAVVIDLRFDLGGPGLVGLVAMLPWIIMAWF